MLYSSYFKLHVCWLYYEVHPWPSPLRGRRKRRSNPLQADLSLTPVTYRCKLLGINEPLP
ncbi:hypothetical protein C9426_33210 [Serratia sp. S1B]|nr:hypothetical protein C9426_33210 [Serratia sp. S1B]